MLEPHLVRALTLDAARHPRGQPHVSSASGLAAVGHHLYVVADDENHLARIDARSVAASPIDLIPFDRAVLPDDASLRKAAKRDLESLIVFPAAAPGQRALLVAWGSASRPQRECAHLLALGANGEIASPPVRVSLSALCDPLRRRYGALNLEAGFVHQGSMHVFQRANAAQPRNGHIRFDAESMREWLLGRTGFPPVPLEMDDIDLGSVDGVPLGITNAAVSAEGGWVFSAVAEDTADAYLDGSCVGSVIGFVDREGRMHEPRRLRGNPKVEGLAFASPDRLWLVTDADDPARASELLELRWPFDGPGQSPR